MSDISEEKYKELKRDVEDAKEAASRAEGALTQLMQRLQDEFECSNLKQASALLTVLQGKKKKASMRFSSALKDYEKKWKKE